MTSKKVFCCLLIGWIACFFLLGPLLWNVQPEKVALAQRNLAPSWQYPAGTDQIGRDVLARTLAGGRISLFVGFLAATLALFLGTLIGLICGYWGGFWDSILMSILDMLRCLPTLLLLLFWQSLSTASLLNVIVVIAVVSWMQTARVIRGQVLSLKEREHVLAAKAISCSDWQILWRHVLPYCWGNIVALFVLEFSGAVLMESSLSFLGLGLPVNVASWGNMLSTGESALVNGYWWQVFFPGIAVVWTLFLIHMYGEKMGG